MYTYDVMATHHDQNQTAEFIGALIITIENRKDALRVELLRCTAEQTEGINLFNTLSKYIQTLKNIPTDTGFQPEYDAMLREAVQKNANLDARLLWLSQHIDNLRAEYDALLQFGSNK